VHPAGDKLARLLTAGACLAWLGAFLWLLTGSRYTVFLAPSYGVLLAGGAGILAALLAAVAFCGRTGCCAAARGTPWLPLAVCLVPVAFLAANPRPLPSAYSFALRAGYERLWRSHLVLGLTGRRLSPTAAVPQPATRPASAPSDEPPEEVTLRELLLDYPGNVGRTVTVVAAVHRGDGVPAGRIVLFRFVITCCAADAVPAAVMADPAGCGVPPGESWVRLRGVVSKARHRGLDLPLLQARDIQVISPPHNPYIR